MKSFKTWLAEKIEYLPLFEMAFKRKNAIEKIQALDIHIANHVVLISIYGQGSPRSITGWTNELIAWFSKIQDIKIKPNNKLFSPGDYFDLLFENPLGPLTSSIPSKIKLWKGSDKYNVDCTIL